jgi:hypothetical protein
MLFALLVTPRARDTIYSVKRCLVFKNKEVPGNRDMMVLPFVWRRGNVPTRFKESDS